MLTDATMATLPPAPLPTSTSTANGAHPDLTGFDDEQITTARRLVATRADNPDDCRALLSMLGLIGPPAPETAPAVPSTGTCGACHRPMTLPANELPRGWAHHHITALCADCFDPDEPAHRQRRATDPGFLAQVVELRHTIPPGRTNPHTWREIGARLGCDASSVRRAYDRAGRTNR